MRFEASSISAFESFSSFYAISTSFCALACSSANLFVFSRSSCCFSISFVSSSCAAFAFAYYSAALAFIVNNESSSFVIWDFGF